MALCVVLGFFMLELLNTRVVLDATVAPAPRTIVRTDVVPVPDMDAVFARGGVNVTVGVERTDVIPGMGTLMTFPSTRGDATVKRTWTFVVAPVV
jgi:hypothetical protein